MTPPAFSDPSVHSNDPHPGRDASRRDFVRRIDCSPESRVPAPRERVGAPRDTAEPDEGRRRDEH